MMRLINTAIAGLRDMQPVASRSLSGDDRILSLFRKWVDAQRAYLATDEAIEAEAEAEKILDLVDEAEDTIASIPATGAVGLAVKAYLYMFRDNDWYVSDGAAIAGRETDETDDHRRVRLKVGLLNEIVAVLPEAAPLADRYIKGLPREVYSGHIEGPRAHEDDQGNDAGPDVIGFGEPEEGGAS